MVYEAREGQHLERVIMKIEKLGSRPSAVSQTALTHIALASRKIGRKGFMVKIGLSSRDVLRDSRFFPTRFPLHGSSVNK